jgi:hypothetical protein
VFPHRLSEVTANEIRRVVETEVPESLDFELKKTLSAKKGTDDPWTAGGDKIGEEARDALAAEIGAFANTLGGTLIIGIDEDTETKRAKPPIIPLPRCKELAERLHQSVGARIEPKLPMFECEGVVTEPDGSSGVVIMRTLESYLAPHRHTQDHHCYIRRNDRAEPMSMLEIQELVRRKARGAEETEHAFRESAERFFAWIPTEHQRNDPYRSLQVVLRRDPGSDVKWTLMWAMRLTARPLGPFVIDNLPKQRWLSDIKVDTYQGSGELGTLVWHDMRAVKTCQPRLRAVEREFVGAESFGLDRVTSAGQVERFVRMSETESGDKPKRINLNMAQVMWNLVSIGRNVATLRAANSRPTQSFALEIELLSSDPLGLWGYPRGIHAVIQARRIVFPRYELGGQNNFDDVLKTFDSDVWNAGGIDPNWDIGANWSIGGLR